MGNHVTLRWETADETDIVGFHIYRQVVGRAERTQLTQELLVAEKSGSTSGAAYTYKDEAARRSDNYRYFVYMIDPSGLETQALLGDVSVRSAVDGWLVFLPVIEDN